MGVEIVYLGADNVIDLVLLEDGVAVDLSAVTKMTLNFNSTMINSDTSPDAFDWSTGDGKLSLALGAESIMTALYDAELTVYDSQNTNGVVWGIFKVVVK